MARRTGNAARYGQALGNVGAANLNTQLQIEQLKRDREDARAAAVNQALGQITGGLVGGLGAAGNIAGNIQQGNIQREQLAMQKAADARAAETARLQQQQMSNQIRREAETEAAQAATFNMSRFAPQAAEAESAEMQRQRSNQIVADSAGKRIGSRVPYSPDKGFYTPEEAKQAMQIVGEETSDLDVGPEAPAGYRAKQELERLKAETKSNIREVLQRNGVQNPTDAQIDSLYARGEAGFRSMEMKQMAEQAKLGPKPKKAMTDGVVGKLSGQQSTIEEVSRLGKAAKSLKPESWSKFQSYEQLKLRAGLPPTAAIAESLGQTRGENVIIGASAGKNASRSIGGYDVGQANAVALQEEFLKFSPEERAFIVQNELANRILSKAIEKSILTDGDAIFYAKVLPNALSGPEVFQKTYNNLMTRLATDYDTQYQGYDHAFDLPPSYKAAHSRWISDSAPSEDLLIDIEPVKAGEHKSVKVDPFIPGVNRSPEVRELLGEEEGTFKGGVTGAVTDIAEAVSDVAGRALGSEEVKPTVESGEPGLLDRAVNALPKVRGATNLRGRELPADHPLATADALAKQRAFKVGPQTSSSGIQLPETSRPTNAPVNPPAARQVDPRLQAAFQAVMGADKDALYNMAQSTDEAGFDMPEPQQQPQQMRQGSNSGIRELDQILANIGPNIDAVSSGMAEQPLPAVDMISGAYPDYPATKGRGSSALSVEDAMIKGAMEALAETARATGNQSLFDPTGMMMQGSPFDAPQASAPGFTPSQTLVGSGGGPDIRQSLGGIPAKKSSQPTVSQRLTGPGELTGSGGGPDIRQSLGGIPAKKAPNPEDDAKLEALRNLTRGQLSGPGGTGPARPQMRDIGAEIGAPAPEAWKPNPKLDTDVDIVIRGSAGVLTPEDREIIEKAIASTGGDLKEARRQLIVAKKREQGLKKQGR